MHMIVHENRSQIISLALMRSATRNVTALKLADPATCGIVQHSFSHDLGTDMWYVCLR